ncbi:rRNA small subunit methyltransferase B [Hoyosella sp. YIM 151337]|uniref:RsmB/NOP family class I SAM-dependent RNA methyltransferase n=1 Tax=Hoyosella sp. YIM 151337 TaxID=2992742 RepID=UPI002236BE68|nr:transcription antitermination factor NusB [Hoyosella sp. YIM 151337]MCW4353198.1 rRNA small subunit methyltransferase B [Hoyosella sp. YIM 151337]
MSSEEPGGRKRSNGRGGRARGTGRQADNTRPGPRRSGEDQSRRAPRRTQPPPAADPAREVARDVLQAVRARDAYANLLLPALLRDRRIKGRDAAFATELTYGTCRALGLLDAIIAAAASRDADTIDGDVLDILRLSAYQLLRTRVAPHAAVSTGVAMARDTAGAHVSGFVNAVLRRVSEKTEAEWVAQLAPPDPIGRLAFTYAHPRWIAQAFADSLGPSAGELSAALAADDARPVVHLAARPGEITAEELALVTGGDEGPYSPYAVRLESGGDPASLEPVRDGLAFVQDEGSQLVALSLVRAPLSGADSGRWLDLCAGPGGKAVLLGSFARIDGAHVDAVEVAAHRARLVRQAVEGLPVTVHEGDGRDPGLSPGYDRILVDAPCTGLGALRRRPEARWRRQSGDIGDLSKLQRELLDSAVRLLRPGGVVVYSTCSPHLLETTTIVAAAVRRHALEQIDGSSLLCDIEAAEAGKAIQLWPHRHGTDAMFIAALRKPASE